MMNFDSYDKRGDVKIMLFLHKMYNFYNKRSFPTTMPRNIIVWCLVRQSIIFIIYLSAYVKKKIIYSFSTF